MFDTLHTKDFKYYDWSDRQNPPFDTPPRIMGDFQ